MKNFLYASLSCSLFLCACGNGNQKNTVPTDTSNVQTKSSSVSSTVDSTAFNIDSIPITTKEVGKFPYLTAPEGYRFNDFKTSDLEALHYAINGKLVALEGKTYKSNIYKNNENQSPFNVQFVSETYNKVILDLGGVKVSSKVIPNEIEKIPKSVLEKENHSYDIIGANEFTLNNVNTYIIKTEKSQIWIEVSFWESGGYINILEKGNK